MTNGEMIQKVFPDMEIEISEVYVFAWIEHEPTHFDVKWWNEEYKGPTPNASYCKLEDCISRDDAIEVLKDWDGYFIGHSSDDVVKALNLAIKALEHPEKNVVAVVPCGDAISREEVLKLMKENWHTHNGDWAMQESLDDIRALPSVTPQPKRGIWQQTNKNEVNVIPEYKCSECGAEYKGFGFDFDYCPRCGCAMEEEE